MGEHKYNPTAIAAKEGKLPPTAEVREEIDIERGVYEIHMTVPREEKQEEPKEAWTQIARVFRTLREVAVRWLTD